MSAADDDALRRLAEAVADGAHVDWEREGATHPGLGPQLRQLRTLQSVASLRPGAAPDPLIGKSLSHYRIDERLGAGGMGVVYRAQDLNLRRRVALKVLPPEVVSVAERRQRFMREARAAAAVTHPNIAAVYEVGEAGGQIFIAMELVEGKTLRELIGGRPLPMATAMRLAIEMVEALAHAHQAGIIHRDLKPDNLMVRADGHLKILDFGLAKLREPWTEPLAAGVSELETQSAELTEAGRVMGTPAYMSPEQARGHPLDARSDTFAFGIILYEMVTGKPPFRRETAADTLGAILKDEPPPASQINADVPPNLDQIIAKCLEKDAGDRYQDTRELLVDLRRAARITEPGVPAARAPGAPVAAAPSSGWTRLLRTAALRTVWVTILVALVVVAGAVFWWRLRAPGSFQSGDRIFVADFENATGETEYDTVVRDVFESMLYGSNLFDTVRGDRLKELVGAHTGGGVSKIDRSLANRVCASGECAAYVMGKIWKEESGYRVAAEVYKVGKTKPYFSGSSTAASAQDLVAALHDLALNLRRAAGEAPHSVAESYPPTTRSLRALQAINLANTASSVADTITLLKRVLEIDPDFVDAYSSLATAYGQGGYWKEFRRYAEEAYRRSSNLPESSRLWIEIQLLDARYDFDTELDRLRAYQRLYPFTFLGFNYLGWQYLFTYQDPVSAEAPARRSYELSTGQYGMQMLTQSLAMLGKAEEIKRLADHDRARKGTETRATASLLWAHAVTGDWERLEGTVALLERQAGSLKQTASSLKVAALLSRGRLADARSAAASAWRAAEQEESVEGRHVAGLQQAWLEFRRSGQPAPFSTAQIEAVQNSLWYLPHLAALSVDLGLAEPLNRLTAAHERAEKGSSSRFVREELEFAKGCLELIRGRASVARGILEPLARNSILIRRHRVLGRAYEALGLWREAAAEYEEVLENPHMRWWVYENPGIWVLDQYRLAQVYERLNDSGRARLWYERFLAGWKEADPEIPELARARERLAALATEAAGAVSPSSASSPG